MDIAVLALRKVYYARLIRLIKRAPKPNLLLV